MKDEYLEVKKVVDKINLFWPCRKAQYLHKWSDEKTKNIENQYRTFFAMIAFNNELAPPNADVDDLWHEHILNTRRYAEACNAVHGKFIHHSSMDGLEDAARDALVKQTVALYRLAGLPTPILEPKANCCCGGSCDY